MAAHSSPFTATRQLILAISIVLTGLAAGFFATYQYSVTRALADVDDVVYVESFQAINATIRSLEFGVIFFGSLLSLVFAVAIFRHRSTVRLLLAAAVVAYVTTLVITFVIHIPLNDSLAVVDASTQSTIARGAFESRWNDMHLVRTLSALAAFVFTVTALVCHNRP